jgi:Protein of unknown function (DUF3047)
MRRLIGLTLTGLLVAGPALAGPAVVLEDWTTQPLGARGIPGGWRGQTWGGPAYDLTVELDGEVRVLRLRSRNEGSTITKEIRGQVDLRATPILEWRWKAVELPAGGDSRRKAADDQAAQLFVVWPRSPEFLRSRILGYVWDTAAPAGTIARSEKTGTVTYIVIRTGPADLGRWVTERRNVLEDYRRIFGEEPEAPGAIALSIDTNDTHTRAESFMGPIRFTAP